MNYQIFSQKPLVDSDSLVLLDLDNTIIDYEKYKYEVWLKAFQDEGFDLDLVDKMYTESKNEQGVYDFILHLKNITKLSDVDEISNRILKKSCDLTSFLFDDSRTYIENICESCNVVLLSFGEVNYQRHKFIATGLDQYFHAAIFTQVRKPEFFKSVLSKDEDGFILSVFPNKKFRRITFVDDHPSELDGIIADDNFARYRIKRPGAKYANLVTPENTKEIDTFLALQDIQ